MLVTSSTVATHQRLVGQAGGILLARRAAMCAQPAWMGSWQLWMAKVKRHLFRNHCCSQHVSKNPENYKEPSSSWDVKAVVRQQKLGYASDFVWDGIKWKWLSHRRSQCRKKAKISGQFEKKSCLTLTRCCCEEMRIRSAATRVSEIAMQQRRNACGWACRPSVSHRHYQPPVRGSRQAAGRWRKHVRSTRRAP